MSSGVHSMTPMTMNQTPWNTRLADRTRLTVKLRGQGIPSSVVASVTAITVWSSQWNWPSMPMWSAEWRWKMSSCCANAAAATSCDTASRIGALALSRWMVTAAKMSSAREMDACSKLWRWSDGMVPSTSNGWCFAGPMTSSMRMDITVPMMISMSSRWRTPRTGNQTGAEYELGRSRKRRVWLNSCHRPMRRKPAPGATCPTRVPMAVSPRFWLWRAACTSTKWYGQDERRWWWRRVEREGL
ncbi:hypothetical protein HU200_037681 [Digitaria exilis]|uniref:Uncharacterized protein n=1 Tax=Digitaria exilis TaxID=1010633 RepID=A0A835EL22_9POAL|nr:hypothetical protein HU200_037681 [Digitaria exilis]